MSRINISAPASFIPACAEMRQLLFLFIAVCAAEDLYPAGLPLVASGYARAGIAAAKAACKQIHVIKGPGMSS
jgi:hypothetical protein